jgi:hypothetical protein
MDREIPIYLPYEVLRQLTASQYFFWRLHRYRFSEEITPARAVPELLDDDEQQWNAAWEMWAESMESVWQELTRAHACAPLSEEEIERRYGKWIERNESEKELANDLMWIVGTLERDGKGWMH